MPATKDPNFDILLNLGIIPPPKAIFPVLLTKLSERKTDKNPHQESLPRKRHKSMKNELRNPDHSYNIPEKKSKVMQSAALEPDYQTKLDQRLGTIESTYFGLDYYKRLYEGIGTDPVISFEPNHLRKVDDRLGIGGKSSFGPNYVCNIDKRLGAPVCTQPPHLKLRIHVSNTHLFKMRNPEIEFLPGYRPFRGEFDVEFDNNAETLLCLAGEMNEVCQCDSSKKNKTEKEDLKLLRELQITLGDIYNVRLKERNRRKKIVKDNGLINQQGHHLWISRLQTSLGKMEIKKLSCLAKLVSADESDKLCASLAVMYDKRAETNKLIYYRIQRGITTKMGVELFERQRVEREDTVERVDVRKALLPQVVRKKKRSTPIYHYARYRDLTVKEAELCSSLALLPEFFLETKCSLISDCQRNKGMLLKKARQLVKIDVNKTRKVFDLLLEEGSIWSPASEGSSSSPVSRGKKKTRKKKLMEEENKLEKEETSGSSF